MGGRFQRIERMRRLGRACVAGVVLAIAAAGTAHADITGQVVDGFGIPVPNASIQVTEVNGGGFASSATTEADGRYTITTSSLTGDPPPYVVTASATDLCRTTDTRRTAAASGIVDGQVVNLALDTFPVCSSSSIPSGGAPPTGTVVPERRLVLGPPGAVVYLRVRVPSGASDFQIRLNNGAAIGSSSRGDQIPITAPGAPGYVGPLSVRYLLGGVEVIQEIALATFVGAARTIVPQNGPIDMALIVDESGSMAGSDPGNQRRAAAEVAIDRSKIGDGIAAVGFDTQPQEIFPYEVVSSNAVRTRLRNLARARIGNGGGTDYDVGFNAGFAELTKPGIDLQRPKAAIFLTDGAHGGTYDNSHLRFANNGSGRPWPVCVVQLARSFNASDVARLRRIASETGGIYVRAPTNVGLTNVYFTCLARLTGQSPVIDRTVSQTNGNVRTFIANIRRRNGQRPTETTFFVGWDRGIRSMVLREPGRNGRTISLATARRLRGMSADTTPTSASITIRNPKLGRWTIRVRAARLTGRGATRLTVTSSYRQPVLVVPTTCAGRPATILGTTGNDVIRGTPGPDVISAGPGNDVVFGWDPNVATDEGDIICLGTGHDRGRGGPGNDVIFGEAGRDAIGGEDGDDFLSGGADRDSLAGHSGRDRILGGPGNDSLFGGDDGDRLIGGTGGDTINGQNGNDVIDGNAGRDVIFAQRGNDTIRGGSGNDRRLDGGPGNDRIFGNSGNDAFMRGGLGNDLLSGGPGNDNIGGGSGRNTLLGGPGRDRLVGGGFRDIIRGGSGNDFIDGSGGPDSLFGNAGRDILLGRNGNDTLIGGTGFDRAFGGSNRDRCVAEFERGCER